MNAHRKPAFGEPCNRCGLCCVATPCELALDAVAGAVRGKPCPVVQFDDAGQSSCPFMKSELLAMIIGQGTGCDSGPALPPHEDECWGMTAADYLKARRRGEAAVFE